MIDLSFPTVKLGDHIRKINLKVKDSEYEVSDFTVYGVTNSEGITVTGQKVSDDIGNYILLQDNQFAYNPYRINVGSLGLFRGNDIGAVSPAYVVFETLGSYDSQFLLFYLKSPLGIKLIKWYGDRGGVRAALRYDDLCKIDVPDISINKQRIIMQNFSLINQRISKYNHQIEKQSRYIAKLRQSILQQAVEGKLCKQNPDDKPASKLLKRIKAEKDRLIKEGIIKKEKPLPPITDEEKLFDLPNGWEWCRMSSLSYYVSTGPFGSALHKSDYVFNGTPIINPTHLINQKIVSSPTVTVDEKNYKRLLSYALQTGDIIIARRGEVGRCALVTESESGWLCGTGCFIMHPYIDCVKYLLLYFKTPVLVNQLTQLSVGTTMTNLNRNMLKKIIIPLPPLEEQKRIVEKVNNLMAYCDELEKQVNESKAYAEKLIQSVLAGAFNAESRRKSVAKVIAIAPQIQSLPVKLAARGSISEETMKHIEQTIDVMCGDS